MKKVLITGCSSGFGRLLVSAFLEKGYKVLATLRNAPTRQHLFKEEIEKYGAQLKILNFDVTSADDLQMIEKYIVQNENSQLDCLVNNAGFGVYGALEDLGVEQIQQQMNINVIGLILTTRSMLKFLRPQHGHIINFSSVLGFSVLPLTSLYCASKYAVEAFSEALYYELAPFGVKVTLIEPGAFQTGFKDNMIWGELSGSERSPYFQQSQNYKKLTGRFSKLRDPRSVVIAVAKLANKSSPPLRIRCGTDANFVYLAKSLVPAPIFRWVNRLAFALMFQKNRKNKK